MPTTEDRDRTEAHYRARQEGYEWIVLIIFLLVIACGLLVAIVRLAGFFGFCLFSMAVIW